MRKKELEHLSITGKIDDSRARDDKDGRIWTRWRKWQTQPGSTSYGRWRIEKSGGTWLPTSSDDTASKEGEKSAIVKHLHNLSKDKTYELKFGPYVGLCLCFLSALVPLCCNFTSIAKYMYRIFRTIRRTLKSWICSKFGSAPYNTVRLVYGFGLTTPLPWTGMLDPEIVGLLNSNTEDDEFDGFEEWLKNVSDCIFFTLSCIWLLWLITSTFLYRWNRSIVLCFIYCAPYHPVRLIRGNLTVDSASLSVRLITRRALWSEKYGTFLLTRWAILWQVRIMKRPSPLIQLRPNHCTGCSL